MTDTPALTPEELAAQMRSYADNPASCYVPIHQVTLTEWARYIEAQARQIEALTAERDRAGKWLPISDDIKVDGQQVLGLVKWEWDTQPRRRIIVWNNGIGKAAYNWPCWMCAVTTTSLPDAIVLAHQPLPSLPEV